MKILLCAVNTKYIHSNLAVNLLKCYADRYAQGTEADIEIAEFTINNYAENVLAQIYRRKPDVLAFSCYIWNIDFIRSLFEDLHKVLPDVSIWLGGPEVSFDAPEILEKYPDVKGIMLGEGEETFKELALDHYTRKQRELKEINGLCFRDELGIHMNACRELMSLDDAPFIYNEDNIKDFENKIIYYETSRGCPFSCSYCLSSIDKKVRFRSLDKVYKELQFFLDHKVPQVKLIDRTFNIDHAHTMGILEYIVNHDNGITNFHFEVAGDILTDDELEIMSRMRPGLIQLEIGVQSTNADTIKEIHRVMKLDKLKSVVSRINAMHNIHQHLDLIAGLPYENYESFARSFNEVYAMEPSQLQLGFLKVLKGAYMFSARKEYDLLYKSDPTYEVLSTKWITYEEILRLKQIEEMVEMYYNTHQFTKSIRLLEGHFDNAFELYSKLAEYYEAEGYFINNPSRVYRYNVLLGFALKIDPEHEEIYREALTFDMYYRENCKSRPDFAADLKEYKDRIRDLKLDRQIHVDVFHYNFLEEDPKEIAVRKEEEILISFDYQNRDPLYYNAKCVLHIH